jgi:hypothetical protein
MMTSPEAGRDGTFRWQLPAGDYGVALLLGGMAPSRVPMFLPSGTLVFVNGIVDPGLEFRAEAGEVLDLGTLVLEIRSRRATDILGNPPVFDRLTGLRVEPPQPAPGVQPRPWRTLPRMSGARG